MNVHAKDHIVALTSVITVATPAEEFVPVFERPIAMLFNITGNNVIDVVAGIVGVIAILHMLLSKK